YAAEVSRVKPERVSWSDAVHNLSRIPLLIEALRTGDLALIAQVIEDRLYLPYLKSHIAGYDHVVEMARRSGAQAVTLTGDGPAIIAFASDTYKNITKPREGGFE